jgi:hypothetical protein
MSFKQLSFDDIAETVSKDYRSESVDYGLKKLSEKPVFFDAPVIPLSGSKSIYRVYADGARHYVALPIADKRSRGIEFDAFFSYLYSESLEQGLSGIAQNLHIRNGLILKYGEFYLRIVLERFEMNLDMYIADRIERKLRRQDNGFDAYFDVVYLESLKKGFKARERNEYIKTALVEKFGENVLYDTYVVEQVKRKEKNLYERKKRFRRKAYLNLWTHFVTFTCDDKKCSVDDFESKLKKCLSNLHTRRGWKYSVVKEYGKKTGRIHFHGLFYIPCDNMVGTVSEVREYNPETRRMEVRNRNSFFYDAFGRNDFAPISGLSRAACRPAMEYIWKYMGKTDERLFYSFDIPTEVQKELSSDDFACRIFDFCIKYVLFDDVFDEEDLVGNKRLDLNVKLNC